MSSQFEALATALSNLEEEKVLETVRSMLNKGIDPKDIINALREGMDKIGKMFEKGEAFIADLVIAADIFKKAVEIIKPHLKVVERGKGRVVIGTVEGDIHDIGKNLVALMLEISGYEIIDLGVDVSADKFAEAIEKYNPDVIGMSALMTTTMLNQKKIIEELKKRGLRNRVKIIVGGAPTTEAWAREIGADAWGSDCFDAVKKVRELLGR
ncbi:MAG: corrinoid protein [Desulfurococcaceae archaeon]|nr:corrinoid protein [Desulfurococcaceae archaeon]